MKLILSILLTILTVLKVYLKVFVLDTTLITLEKPTITDPTLVETPEWISNKKCTINPQNNDNNDNWENINFPLHEQDYKTLKMNNKSIALNVLQANNEQKISHHYKSKFNKTRENKVISLMINGNEKQHYLFVKNLNALLKKQYACSENYCIHCLKPFRTMLNVNHFHNQNPILPQSHQ